MTAEESVQLIKQVGYWRVVCYPLTAIPTRIPDLSTLWKLLEKNTVKWRGWDYPHIDNVNREPGQDHVCSFTVWGSFREYVQFHQSGQFIHLHALHEDFERDLGLIPSGNPLSPDVERFMDFIGLLYSMTEMLEFIGRLARADVRDTKLGQDGLHIEIDLHGTKDRRLVSAYNPAISFRGYVCRLPSIHYARDIAGAQALLLGSEVALDVAKFFYERFGWLDPSIGILREHQAKLIERRL